MGYWIGLVLDLIASITPNYLETIRGFFNETLMDLLYYASPIFGPEVRLSLEWRLDVEMSGQTCPRSGDQRPKQGVESALSALPLE